ncbi:unnamed protein product, partial [Porites evermanni]
MPVDLFLLQEIHLVDSSQGKAWEKEWGSQCAWSLGSNRSAGNRYGCNQISQTAFYFQIINVYRPNNHNEREIFSDNLWHFKYSNLETIVVGDFNCVPDIAIDKWGGDDSFGDRAVTQLHSFTKSLALEDFYRGSNPR